MESINEMKYLTKSLLYDLEKGNRQWEDETIQFFLPAGLYFANFDLLKVCAENLLVDEDAQIVNNFLDKLEAICSVNEQKLHEEVENKLDRIIGDLL